MLLDEPEIQVEKSWVHADVGIEAEISCIVHAVPSAEVRITTVVYKNSSFKLYLGTVFASIWLHTSSSHSKM